MWSSRRREWDNDKPVCRESVASLGYPVFVKPARGGSSVGISRVNEPEQLDDAIELARQHDAKVIVEAAAIGVREVECGVLERLDGGADASAVAEITGYGEPRVLRLRGEVSRRGGRHP